MACYGTETLMRLSTFGKLLTTLFLERVDLGIFVGVTCCNVGIGKSLIMFINFFLRMMKAITPLLGNNKNTKRW